MIGAYRSLDEMNITASELHAWFDVCLKSDVDGYEFTTEELNWALAENDKIYLSE